MKISLHAPKFTGNEIKYVNECIRTSWLSPAGKFVSVFEKEIAKYTKSKFAIACINGTAALKDSEKVISAGLVSALTVTILSAIGNPLVFFVQTQLNPNRQSKAIEV